MPHIRDEKRDSACPEKYATAPWPMHSVVPGNHSDVEFYLVLLHIQYSFYTYLYIFIEHNRNCSCNIDAESDSFL